MKNKYKFCQQALWPEPDIMNTGLVNLYGTPKEQENNFNYQFHEK